jgi:hypothetical protein
MLLVQLVIFLHQPTFLPDSFYSLLYYKVNNKIMNKKSPEEMLADVKISPVEQEALKRVFE